MYVCHVHTYTVFTRFWRLIYIFFIYSCNILLFLVCIFISVTVQGFVEQLRKLLLLLFVDFAKRNLSNKKRKNFFNPTRKKDVVQYSCSSFLFLFRRSTTSHSQLSFQHDQLFFQLFDLFRFHLMNESKKKNKWIRTNPTFNSTKPLLDIAKSSETTRAKRTWRTRRTRRTRLPILMNCWRLFSPDWQTPMNCTFHWNCNPPDWHWQTSTFSHCHPRNRTTTSSICGYGRAHASDHWSMHRSHPPMPTTICWSLSLLPFGLLLLQFCPPVHCLKINQGHRITWVGIVVVVVVNHTR